MGREFEVKFRANPRQMEAILEAYPDFREIAMETVYYDTEDRALSPRYWTLRRRMENGVAVCTLKTPCADGGRCEWETECAAIEDAIDGLCKLGAPEELKELTAGGLREVCSARFIRKAVTVEVENGTVELAVDRGILRGGVRIELLGEAEVELKSGSDEAALAFARELAAKYGLVQETRSKYRRALALAGY